MAASSWVASSNCACAPHDQRDLAVGIAFQILQLMFDVFAKPEFAGPATRWQLSRRMSRDAFGRVDGNSLKTCLDLGTCTRRVSKSCEHCLKWCQGFLSGRRCRPK